MPPVGGSYYGYTRVDVLIMTIGGVGITLGIWVVCTIPMFLKVVPC